MIKEFEEIIYNSRKRLFSFGYGLENTPLFGNGEEFAKIADYDGGDIRHLNYKASARSRKAKINLYHESKNLDVILLYIASASMLAENKHHLAIEILTSLSYSTSLRGDRVSALIYSDEDSQYISKYRGDKLSYIIYDKLINIYLKGKRASINRAFDEVMAINRRRSLIFVISDFFEIADIEKLSYKNEVVLIKIRERAEEYPNLLNGEILIDPYSGDAISANIDRLTLKRYQNQLSLIDNYWDRVSREQDIIYISLYTDNEPYSQLNRALSMSRDRL